MSSDYLNYELSKELHDLGVVFECESLWTSQLDDQALVHSSGRLHKNCICHPSTAQLIDEIASRRYFILTLDEDLNEFDVSILFNDPHSGKCATTALGKSLIALVKGDE